MCPVTRELLHSLSMGPRLAGMLPVTSGEKSAHRVIGVNNTWRERLQQDDRRNNTWREQRSNEDWRQREGYAKDRTKNNAIDRGYVECGVGSVGSSMPCRDYAKEKTPNNAVDRAYVECGPDAVVEACRSRSDSRSLPLPEPDKQTERSKTGGVKTE